MKRVKAPDILTSAVWLGLAVVFATWQPLSGVRLIAVVLFGGLALWGFTSAVRAARRGRNGASHHE